MKEHIQDILAGGRPMTKLELANKEIERLQAELDKTRLNELEKEYRIFKAREYIEENAKPFIDDYGYVLTNDKMIYSDEILEILQGSNKE